MGCATSAEEKRAQEVWIFLLNVHYREFQVPKLEFMSNLNGNMRHE